MKTVYTLSYWYSFDSSRWIISDEYLDVLGFQSFISFLCHFELAKLTSSSIRVKVNIVWIGKKPTLAGHFEAFYSLNRKEAYLSRAFRVCACPLTPVTAIVIAVATVTCLEALAHELRLFGVLRLAGVGRVAGYGLLCHVDLGLFLQHAASSRGGPHAADPGSGWQTARLIVVPLTFTYSGKNAAQLNGKYHKMFHLIYFE